MLKFVCYGLFISLQGDNVPYSVLVLSSYLFTNGRPSIPGKQHLPLLLLAFNILAFLFHTVLEMMDERYHMIRKELPTRKTFFDDIRALTRYICFDSWDHMLRFMMEGLELEYPDTS